MVCNAFNVCEHYRENTHKTATYATHLDRWASHQQQPLSKAQPFIEWRSGKARWGCARYFDIRSEHITIQVDTPPILYIIFFINHYSNTVQCPQEFWMFHSTFLEFCKLHTTSSEELVSNSHSIYLKKYFKIEWIIKYLNNIFRSMNVVTMIADEQALYLEIYVSIRPDSSIKYM